MVNFELFSVTVQMEFRFEVLWPFLFEYVCVESFTAALPDLCRSLVPLAQRLNVENRLTIVYPSSNGSESSNQGCP